MGATTATVLAASSAALNLGKGVHDIVQGGKRRREADEALENYQRQDLTNVYAGMSVPTRGAQLQTAGAYQSQAEQGYALSQTGARGVIGGSQTIADNTRESMARISAGLQESELRLQQMFTEDEARIRGIQEQREQQDITGLGAERASGYAQRDAGWSNLSSTLASSASLAQSMPSGETQSFAKETAPEKMTSRGLDTTEVQTPRTLSR